MKTNRDAVLRRSGMRALLLQFFCALFLLSCSDNFGTALHNVSGNGDGPVPGNSGIVSASFLSSTLLDVRWQKGNDSATAADCLQYRVFACSSQTASYDESLSLGTELTQGWSVDIDEVKSYVSGNPSWCNVYVRNEDGKIASYHGAVPTVYANVPPSPGGNGLIILARSFARITASWSKGSDLETGQSSLVYRVFYSLSDNISSFQNASSNGTEITAGWTQDLSSAATDVLPPQTTYWFNIFVMDGDGRISAYTASSIVTGSTAAPVPGRILSCTLSRTSALFSWLPAAGTGILSYRVFRTNGDSSVNTLTSYDNAVRTGTELTGGWTQDLNTAKADALSPGSVYYAVVFVKDGSGMIASYEPFSVNLSSDAAPLAGGSGVIRAASASGTNITVSWEKASDDYTQSELLRYRVYMSTASTDLSGSALPAESSAVTEITKGWTDDISSAAFILPLRQMAYYFNVYVCDRSGNISSYTVFGFFLGMSRPPSAGGSGALTVLSGASSGSLMLCWTKGFDDETPVSQLQYRVYRFSSDPSIVSVNQLPSVFNSEITSGWTADISSAAITAVNTASLYYYDVYVRDGDGQIQSYASVKGAVVSGAVQPGGSGVITAAPRSAKKVALSWSAAVSSGSSPASGLRYAVYSSQSQSDILTYSAAASNASCELAFTSCSGDPILFEAKMSAKNVTYWFNVFVMDANNAVAAYTPVSAVTGE